MRQVEFNKMAFLKAFTYVDAMLGIVRVEVRRDVESGLTLMKRTPLGHPPRHAPRMAAAAH